MTEGSAVLRPSGSVLCLAENDIASITSHSTHYEGSAGVFGADNHTSISTAVTAPDSNASLKASKAIRSRVSQEANTLTVLASTTTLSGFKRPETRSNVSSDFCALSSAIKHNRASPASFASRAIRSARSSSFSARQISVLPSRDSLSSNVVMPPHSVQRPSSVAERDFPGDRLCEPAPEPLALRDVLPMQFFECRDSELLAKSNWNASADSGSPVAMSFWMVVSDSWEQTVQRLPGLGVMIVAALKYHFWRTSMFGKSILFGFMMVAILAATPTPKPTATPCRNHCTKPHPKSTPPRWGGGGTPVGPCPVSQTPCTPHPLRSLNPL
jgi:hypothetical protein